MEVLFKRSSTERELQEILLLQKENLSGIISADEKRKEGFVTVSHSLDILSQMNNRCPHIIATYKERVIGYALCMHPDFAKDIPVLQPMFERLVLLLDPEISFMVMGQICIDKTHRKQGVFRGLYNFMQMELKREYHSIITEVDSENIRSLNAHLAIGFREIDVHSSGGRIWHLVQWEI